MAALYTVLTLCLQPFSYGPIQFRVAEAMTVLPLIFPEAVPALFVGCILSNMLGFGIFDVVIGSSATLVAAVLTAWIGKTIKKPLFAFLLGIIPPVVINAFAVPLIFLLSGSVEEAYLFNVLTVAVGELLSVSVIGGILFFAICPLPDKRRDKNG